MFEMAKLVTLSCILVVVLLGSAESNDKFRIIGGVPAKSGQFPSLVSVQYYWQHICGGTIISEKVILTAAHCLKNKNGEYISIVAGSHDIRTGGERFFASKITPHEGFTFEGADSDVGLIFLSTPLTYSATIQPAELPMESEDYHDSKEYVTVAGWGIMSQGTRPTTTARYAKIPLWGRTTCLLYVPNLSNNMICAGAFDGQKNACPGDSGGPIFIGKKVIGTVSYGYGCGTPNAPGVYANVANYRSWISSKANV